VQNYVIDSERTGDIMSIRPIFISITAALLATLTGCASTGAPVDRTIKVSDAVLAEARGMAIEERTNNAMMYRMGVAASALCGDGEPQYRAPFSLIINNPTAKPEMRAALYAVIHADKLPVLQALAPSLAEYDGAEVAALNGESFDKPQKAAAALGKAVRANEDITLRFADGRQVVTHAISGCPSTVMVNLFGKTREPVDVGATEVLPRSWSQLPASDDERAFILARSMYFTGSEGGAKLRNAALGGAVANGLLRAVTLNLSGAVVDLKTQAVRVRRASNRTDADAFALRVMARAGFAPSAALAFARRAQVEGAVWPDDCAELRFDAKRIEQMEDALRGVSQASL
jgi:hypothetical protein